MKKALVLVLFFLFVSNLMFAQEGDNEILKNKKGQVILPEAGDYAIGVSATPFIDLVGNLIKINSAGVFTSPLTWNFVDPVTNAIYGKYFVNDQTAYRFAFRIGTSSVTKKNYVTDDNDNTKDVLDKWTSKNTFVYLSLAMEKRVGKGRLQMFYGAGPYLSFTGSTDIYKYGNEMSSSNTTPTSTIVWGAPPISGPTGTRTLLNRQGKTIGLGGRGFVGAEYFIMPKVSIGGEFGYDLGLSFQGDGLVQTESYNTTTSAVEVTDAKTGGSFKMSMDVDNFSGIIYIMFYL